MADTKKNPKGTAELSEKELSAKREEITNYYKDHIPHLQAQLEYENLLRDIEKCRAERMQAQMFMTKMASGAPEAPAAPAAPPNIRAEANSYTDEERAPINAAPPGSRVRRSAPEFTKEQKEAFEAAAKKRTLKKVEKND